MANESRQSGDLKEILRIGWRHRRLFLVTAAVGVMVCLAMAPKIPVKYTGTAKFTRSVDPASEHITGARSESFGSRKLTLMNDISGQPAIERVVEDLHLTRGLPRSEDGLLTAEGERAKRAIIQDIQDRLQVTWEVQSDRVDLIAVSFTSPDPLLAEQVPNKVVHNYISWVTKQLVENLGESKQYLETQLERIQQRLDDANKELIEFEAKHSGMMPESPHMLTQQITRTLSDLDHLRRQQTIARNQIEQLERLTSTTTTTQPTSQPIRMVKIKNPELVKLQEQLSAAEEHLKIKVEVQRVKESHPTISLLKRDVERIKEKIASTEKEIEVPMARAEAQLSSIDLEVQLVEARSMLEMTEKEIARLEERLDAFNRLKADFGSIRQEYESYRRNVFDLEADVKQHRANYTKLEMALAAETAKRRTHHYPVLAAYPQHLPSWPSPTIVLGGSIAGGLALASLAVFIAHKTDQTISTVEEAEVNFDAPVRGVIGEISTPSTKARHAFASFLVWPLIYGIMLAGLMIGTLNVVLWLRYPEKHKQWKKSPVTFIQEIARAQVGRSFWPLGKVQR